MKPTYKSCKKNFNVLTKEGFCAYCFKNENEFWPKDFSDKSEKKGGIK